jgi:phage protein D
MSQRSKTISSAQLRLLQVELAADVLIGGAKLDARSSKLLTRVVVDLHVRLPDSFELTFRDPRGDVLSKTGLAIGKAVEIRGDVANQDAAPTLIKAEVTAIEGTYGDTDAFTVVRGYAVDHRLQRVRRTRTFLKMKDSDLARRLADDAGLTVGTIDATDVAHPQLSQDNQTDWEVLRERAEEIGYEVGVANGSFYFRQASDVKAGPAAVALAAGDNLLRFSPRVTSASLVDEVEVRAWDPVNAKAVAARKPVTASGVDIGAGKPDQAARIFASKSAPPAASSQELGPAPSPKARVIYDRAVTIDSNNTQAINAAASALAESTTSGFAEAEGLMIGDARVVAGAVLDVQKVPKEFAGKWTVTRARHEFDNRPGGSYETWFVVSGRQDRSLLALTDGVGNVGGPPRIQGVVGGIVSSLDDPLGLARVKVTLPWLSPEYETGWAPVVQLSAGKDSGAMFLPEPGDQVLVSFEFGDLRRPYVIGSVVNKRTGAGGFLGKTKGDPGAVAVQKGTPSSVVYRGIKTPAGSRLEFHDVRPPNGGKPTAEEVVLSTEGDKVGLTLDAVKGELRLKCVPGSPPGTLVIECGGAVEIKAGASGSMTIDGGQSLKLKAGSVSVESTGQVAIKGSAIQLN